ncbi:hypothetical protein GW17_00053592 [Ensete ventricosum]|nr:hypothetical protein GW17_00053592 [Ensete ventricosum]
MVVPSASSEGTRSEVPEASVSGSSSSGIPSPVDVKSLSDLENSPPEVEKVRVETTPKRPAGSLAPEQAATARLGKRIKIAVKKHKSSHGEGSSRAIARGEEPMASIEGDSSPTYHRPKTMKDLCETRVRKDDEGYYILQMANWAPKDLTAMMQARWLNLSYMSKVWDDSQAASEFGRGGFALDPNKGSLHLALQDLYGKSNQTNHVGKLSLRGHHYQITLLDRVHDVGHLVTIMGNRASLLEVDKERNGLQADLADSQCQIKEKEADHHKADDDMLKMMKENETLKAELLSKSVADYKQSVGFGGATAACGSRSRQDYLLDSPVREKIRKRWFGDIYTCNRGCLAQSLSLLQYLTAPRIDFPGVPGSSNGATSVQPRRKPSAVQQADRRAESSGCPCRDRVGI